MKLTRDAYARLYGPTAGDMVRLGDTSLLAEIERDHTHYGDELTAGAGKIMRDGEGFCTTGTQANGALDMVILNAVIIDAELGIVKGDIGIRDGRIVGVGKAGNPDIMEGVDPDLVTGPNTTTVHGDNHFVTAGAIEAHAHFLSPQQSWHALAGGTTTMIGMSPGPNFDVSCSGPNVLGRLIQAADEFPLNFGFLGRGNSNPEAVAESVAGGALGVKIHEDFGASPAVLDGSLIAADAADFSVHLHTDTINEFGFYETTMEAIAGRGIHMYHTEGAGGGHAPDILVVNGYENVLPSSTNPTNPYTLPALEEGVPMTMLAHMMSFDLLEDVAFAEARIRPQSMAAEDLLHDMGAISIFATDTQGMGRLAENIAKCWQLASVMKDRVGRLPEETTARADNERILRYIAKYTINPALTHGIADHVGSVEVGKLADIVLWKPMFFGVKPDLILKSGSIAGAAMGDPNASIPTPQPVHYRPMFASFGRSLQASSVSFISKAAEGIGSELGLRKETVSISNPRSITKQDMILNDYTPDMFVDPETYEVRADGELLICEPAQELAMAQRYFLF